MKSFCIAIMVLLFFSCHRKAISTGTNTTISPVHATNKLLGIHTKDDLQQAPYQDWFTKNYTAYTVDTATAAQLGPLLKDKHIEIFMGTWCGDSKREVPRMLKILDCAGVPAAQITLIMVDDEDSAYKQSPGHEEKGKFIHRVPDLLLYSNEQEMNRIVESPVVSLEKDLLAIATSKPYQPNYKAAAFLEEQFTRSNMQDIIKDSAALTAKLQSLVKNSAELNSLGCVWMATGQMDKALFVLELNAKLFPAVANVYDSLAEIAIKRQQKEKAKIYYAKLLALDPGNTSAAKKLAALY